MFQSGRPHRTGSQFKTVMFPHTFRRPDKRMLAAKVCQRTIQSTRTPSGRHSQALRQQPHVTTGPNTPNPLAHLHQPKHTPPLQCFFLRLRALGSCCLYSRLACSSAAVAHWLMPAWPKRRISSTSNPSTSSAVFMAVPSLRVMPRMLWKRASNSGCSLSCSINCCSSPVNGFVTNFFFNIPTLLTKWLNLYILFAKNLSFLTHL